MEKKRKLLTEREAAEYLNLAPGTLRQWRHERRGPPYHAIEGAVRYSLEDLNGWLEKHRQPLQADAVPPQDGE